MESSSLRVCQPPTHGVLCLRPVASWHQADAPGVLAFASSQGMSVLLERTARREARVGTLVQSSLDFSPNLTEIPRGEEGPQSHRILLGVWGAWTFLPRPPENSLLLGHDLPGSISNSCMNKKASLFMVQTNTGQGLKCNLLTS